MGSAKNEVTAPPLVGNYRLLGELGRDVLGVLHLACPAGAREFPKWAVVRRVHPGVARDVALVQAFLAATRVALRVVHPNVAATFDCGPRDKPPWIAREHLSGETVLEVIQHATQTAKLPWELACHIVSEAALGLEGIRMRTPGEGPPIGFITGAAPPYIVVSYAGDVKIIDGCLPLIEGKPMIDSASLPYLPSGLAGEPIEDARPHVFGLGVILWELVAGRRLFLGDNDDETLRLVEARVVPFLRNVAPSAAPLDEIVRRALGKSSSDAFESVSELERDLRACVEAYGSPMGREDLARFMRGAFAGRVADQKTALEDAWAVAQVMQETGGTPVFHHVDIDTAVSVSHNMVPEDTGLTHFAPRADARRHPTTPPPPPALVYGFEDIPTLEQQSPERLPPEPPSWRTPGFSSPQAGSPGFSSLQAGSPGFSSPQAGSPGFSSPQAGSPGFSSPQAGSPGFSSPQAPPAPLPTRPDILVEVSTGEVTAIRPTSTSVVTAAVTLASPPQIHYLPDLDEPDLDTMTPDDAIGLAAPPPWPPPAPPRTIAPMGFFPPPVPPPVFPPAEREPAFMSPAPAFAPREPEFAPEPWQPTMRLPLPPPTPPPPRVSASGTSQAGPFPSPHAGPSGFPSPHAGPSGFSSPHAGASGFSSPHAGASGFSSPPQQAGWSVSPVVSSRPRPQPFVAPHSTPTARPAGILTERSAVTNERRSLILVAVIAFFGSLGAVALISAYREPPRAAARPPPAPTSIRTAAPHASATTVPRPAVSRPTAPEPWSPPAPAGIPVASLDDLPRAAPQPSVAPDYLPRGTAPPAATPEVLPRSVPTAVPTDLPRAPPPRPQPRPAPAPPADPPPPAPAPVGKTTGLLSVFCTPACDRVLDGSRSLGPSPVFKASVSAGVHHLRLKIDSPPAQKDVTVTVPENDTTVVRESVGQ